MGLSGDIFLTIEIRKFKITTLQFGFKKLYIKGGIGMDIDSRYTWSYSYDHMYNIINKFKIVSFSVGVISFDIYADFITHLGFDAFAEYHTNINYGINMDVDVGGLYVNYENGKWNFVKPQPDVCIAPYVKADTVINGNTHLKVIPEISIYTPSIFNIHMTFDPKAELNTHGAVSEKKICIDGSYDMNLVVGASILKEKLDDITLYSSGKKKIIDKCVNF
jgi:hypothetical protein